MDSLGKRLQHFRLESGWSKRALAERLGVSIPSIIRWEADIAVPNDYNRYKIEQFLAGAIEARSDTESTDRADGGQLGLFAESKRLGRMR